MISFQIQQRLKVFPYLLVHLSRPSNYHTTSLPSFPQLYRKYAYTTETLPRVTQPSIWQSMVPKFLRTSQASSKSPKPKSSKEWNPATFFIVIFMLIGSNAIQMIALRHEFTTFSRKADAKIGLLKEVIERLQRGEDVDIEGLLGTGNEAKEREWEEALREIEEEDRLWQSNAEKRQRKKLAKEAKSEEAAIAPSNPDTDSPTPSDDNNPKASEARRPSFY